MLSTRGYRAASSDPLAQRVRPNDQTGLKLEGLREEFPIAAHEAQHRVHRHVGHIGTSQRLVDGGPLADETVEQLRAVAAADEETDIGGQPAADIVLLDSTVVILGVDDPDTTRRHHEVVDVRPLPRTPAIMQDPDARREESVETCPNPAFAFGSAGPRSRRAGLGAQRDDEPTKSRMGRANPVLATAPAAVRLVLSRCARA